MLWLFLRVTLSLILCLMCLDKQSSMGRVARNLVSTALITFFVLCATNVEVNAQAFSDSCCAYYASNYVESSAYCNVLDLQTGQVDESIPTFQCSKLINSHNDCPDKGPAAPVEGEDPVCLFKSNVVYPIDLKASIILPQSVKSCPKLENYTLKFIEKQGNHPHCTAGNLFANVSAEGKSIKQLFEAALQVPMDAEKQKILQDLAAIKQKVDKAATQSCCIPKTPTQKTRCAEPRYTDFGSALFAWIGNPSYQQPLAQMFTDTPISTEGGASNAYYYLTCGSTNDWDAIPYSCNTNQKFAPPEWAGGGAGIEVPLSAYCKLPDQTVFCACPTDGTPCNEIAFSPYKTAGSTEVNPPDKYCRDFISNKFGWECIRTEIQPACQKWELICDYSSGKASDCHCPNAGTEVKTDECKGVITKNLSKPKENYSGTPLDIEGIRAMGARLNKNTATSFQQLLGIIIKTITGLIGSIALAMFIYGGIMIMGSAGSEERTKKGTQILIWSALGVIIVLSAYTLVSFVFEIF